MPNDPEHPARPETKHPADAATDEPRQGLVIVNYGKHQLLEDTGGKLQHCVARRGLAQMVCGDAVEWLSTGPGEGVIEAILPRRSVLQRVDRNNGTRPLAANIDRVIIEAAIEPELDRFLIDKYTVAAELAGCEPMIVVNKSDLLNDTQRSEIEQLFFEYNAIGYTTLYTSAKENTGIAEFEQQLKDNISILVGQSGVGKSSLVKRLLPKLDIEIGRLSAASGEGKHTTTATTLYHLSHGGKLIDSPGVRDFKLGKTGPLELGDGFREFHDLQNACKFNDCTHLDEPGCAVSRSVEAGTISRRRYETYRSLLAIMRNME